MSVATVPIQSLEAFDKKAHSLVKDLHSPNPFIFWADLLITSAIGFVLFAVAVAVPMKPWQFLASAAGASLAFYRSLCFIHEISHIKRNSLPGFEFVWNLLAGVPLLMPTFMYVGVHQDHHGLATYGTLRDPEYLPFSSSRKMIVIFVIQSLVLPLLLLLRFLPLSLIGLISPPIQRLLARHASALSMNLKYERVVKDSLLKTMRIWQVYILVFWGIYFYAALTGFASWRILGVWYLVTAFAALVNNFRALGAHHYDGSMDSRPRFEQLRDSIDTPGGIWTELWAPVGLRYHALHHYFPGIPYHNLGKAYRRLTDGLSPYVELSSPSLATSVRNLFAKAGS